MNQQCIQRDESNLMWYPFDKIRTYEFLTEWILEHQHEDEDIQLAYTTSEPNDTNIRKDMRALHCDHNSHWYRTYCNATHNPLTCVTGTMNLTQMRGGASKTRENGKENYHIELICEHGTDRAEIIFLQPEKWNQDTAVTLRNLYLAREGPEMFCFILLHDGNS